MKFRQVGHLLYLILFIGPFSQITLLRAQGEPPKSVRAVHIENGDLLVLDGRIEESLWSDIQPIEDLVMQVPREGGIPTERSEIKIAYDENNLYIAIDFLDSDPSLIKAFQKKRDVRLDTDDRFQWILDTYRDGRNAYYFAINPAGVMTDGLLTIGQGTSLNLNWDGIWRVWTHVHARGWSAEIRIPFRSLNFNPNQTSWGINFQRTIRRKNEELVWSGHQRSQGLQRPQNAGTLEGLNNISQGLGLEAIPYAAARKLTVREGDELQSEYEGDLGFDLNYNLSPSLKASLTVNTDFAEAEVDTRRINLTRFPLFFPEKRDFFLEGSSIYSFAPTSGVNPYFSRKIGLQSGRSVPIAAGLRMLGRVGEFDLAAQHVRTASDEQFGPEDFSVFRVKRNIGRESRLGFIYTRRSTSDQEDLSDPLLDRQTVGFDLELNTSKFLGDQNLQFQAFFVYHNADRQSNTSEFWDRTSRGFRINFPNRPWSAHASYREFGTDFNPALGFHPRVGFRRFQPSFSFNPLLENSQVVRDIDFSFRFEHLMDMDWNLLTQVIRFGLFDLTLESGERFELNVGRQFERLTEPFDILRDGSIIIPEGDYAIWQTGIEMQSASYRRFAARVDLELGGFWSGTKTEVAGSFTYRPIPGIHMTATYVYTQVSLDEGSFSTDLIRFNTDLDLTPFVSFTTYVQWDNLSDQLGINNRLRWILTPGNDFFLVYNHNWQDQFDRFVTTNNTTTMKLAYTHRF